MHCISPKICDKAAIKIHKIRRSKGDLIPLISLLFECCRARAVASIDIKSIFSEFVESQWGE